MGTLVSFVWNSPQPASIQHEYLLSGTEFKTDGVLKLKGGPTLQRFFVVHQQWSEGEGFELKLWQKEIPLLPEGRSGRENRASNAPTYRLALGVEDQEAEVR